jgi:hypothetical protein
VGKTRIEGRSPRRRSAVFPGVIVLLLAAAPAAAQPRVTRENPTAWFALFCDVEVARNWFVDYEAQVRREGPVQHWQQFLPRLSIRHRFHPNAQVSWGVTTPETWPYGKTPVTYRFPERRMWEQLLLTHAAGRVTLSHRYRLEQRWLGRVVEENGEERVANWVRSNRIRYRAAGVIPLRGATLDVGEPYANVNGELFINWGANVASNVFDQYRLNAMLGLRLTKGVRLEAGYLEQLVLRPNGRQLERNHTMMVALLTSQSLVR